MAAKKRKISCEAVVSGGSGDRLSDQFYDVDCETLAKSLLGRVLVRRTEDGAVLKGRIVETECYLGGEDKASHSYQGKQTSRNEPMFMEPGTSYVYTIYGMYSCFNISSKGAGAAVLIRALDPVVGQNTMNKNRAEKRKKPLEQLKDKQLCNGPSKLCQALQIYKDNCNKLWMPTSESIWLEDDEWVLQSTVVATKRIGIDSCGEEWANKPLRFYVMGNQSVSKRDKKAEGKIMEQLNT